jgi:hypothetical protein
VPGADDETILSDILSTARLHAELVKEGLQALDASARQRHEASFASLDQDGCMSIVGDFQQTLPRFLHALTSITLQCYYRDARVMESLGMEARPPFPNGFELEEGDWSLLDPVRQRGRIWRDAGE